MLKHVAHVDVHREPAAPRSCSMQPWWFGSSIRKLVGL